LLLYPASRRATDPLPSYGVFSAVENEFIVLVYTDFVPPKTYPDCDS
jgi:hypothetical protein